MNWLIFLFAFEFGVSPQVGILAYNETISADSLEYGVYYTQLEAEAELWEHLFISGSIRTYILPSGTVNFSPREVVYDFSIGMRWQPFEFGWRHRCFHPIMPYLPTLDIDVRGIEGGYDEIYLRVEVKR